MEGKLEEPKDVKREEEKRVEGGKQTGEKETEKRTHAWVEDEWEQNVKWSTLKPLCLHTGVSMHSRTHSTQSGCWAFGIFVLRDSVSPISQSVAACSRNLFQAHAQNFSSHRHEGTEHFPLAKQYVGAMGNSAGLRAAITHTHTAARTRTQSGRQRTGMDRAYATFGSLAAPWLYCSFSGARGSGLIKGFVSWEWEQGGRKEGGKKAEEKQMEQRKRGMREDECRGYNQNER